MWVGVAGPPKLKASDSSWGNASAKRCEIIHCQIPDKRASTAELQRNAVTPTGEIIYSLRYLLLRAILHYVFVSYVGAGISSNHTEFPLFIRVVAALARWRNAFSCIYVFWFQCRRGLLARAEPPSWNSCHIRWELSRFLPEDARTIDFPDRVGDTSASAKLIHRELAGGQHMVIVHDYEAAGRNFAVERVEYVPG